MFVKVLESAALGWVRARVIRVKSGGRVVVQSDQGRESPLGQQVASIEPAGFRPGQGGYNPTTPERSAHPRWSPLGIFCVHRS